MKKSYENLKQNLRILRGGLYYSESKSLPLVSGKVRRTKKAHIAKIEAVINALPFPIISPLNKKANELTAMKAKSGGAIAEAPLPTL